MACRVGGSMSDKLVVFYSWGDNTKAVAEYISEKTGADIFELKVKDAYPSDYDACVNKVGRDGKQYEPVLVNESIDIKNNKMIFAGSPCWWGTIANPLRTFLHSYDFAGKIIAPFMTHGTSGLHVQDIKKLCPEARVQSGLGIYNKYQVSTSINSVSNMGDYKSQVDVWLGKIES